MFAISGTYVTPQNACLWFQGVMKIKLPFDTDLYIRKIKVLFGYGDEGLLLKLKVLKKQLIKK